MAQRRFCADRATPRVCGCLTCFRLHPILPFRYNPPIRSIVSLGLAVGETVARDELRVGIGQDLHRLAPGGPLRLGGVEIPHDRHLVGHSDADVLLHAVVDALLGAAALGDVGQMFPDTDPANRGRDSAEMVTAARQAIEAVGWRVGNVDCVVLAQRPKLLPYRQALRARIAELLQIELERVSVKGKTGEQVGLVGREEVIAVQCVALLRRG